MFISIRIIQTL